MRSAEQTKNEIYTVVFVLDVTDQVTNNKVHRLTISIRPRPGSNDIDFSNLTVEVADGSKMVLLIFNDDTTWNFNVTLDDGQVFCIGAWNETATEFGVIVLEERESSITQNSPIANTGDLVLICVNTTNCFSSIDGNVNVW